MDPIFFANPAEFREWLAANAGTATEIQVGYYRVATGRPSMTWAQSVDEALCVGWIDGVRRGIDDERYTIRFTPRKPTSKWSAVNVRRVAELTAEGRMQPAGLAAFERRNPDIEPYSYGQQKNAELDPEAERTFRRNRKAWRFFQSQPPGYRRTAIHWVTSAKRAETRQRRLATLIEDSARGERLRNLFRSPPTGRPG
ncbi:MAG TPA: YdeI/OmpD-associated family protein [Acidimicrobiales bacterium]|nr:YdeI/OmpD-associated family protein [Acidimicrobiales bacterium]